jgi:ribosomal-protein-alanine N-acetyltransferase
LKIKKFTTRAQQLKIIETKRLILRPFKISDAKNMFDNWANNYENLKFLTWKPHKTIQETQLVIWDWIQQYEKNLNFYMWAITLKNSNKAIGAIGSMATSDELNFIEIGFVLSKIYWNQGITTEAVKSVIRYLFKNSKFTKIKARCIVDNIYAKYYQNLVWISSKF